MLSDTDQTGLTAVSGEETAGARTRKDLCGRGVAPAGGVLPQPSPDLDTVDLMAVCDCDTAAILAWRRGVRGPTLPEAFKSLTRSLQLGFAFRSPPT